MATPVIVVIVWASSIPGVDLAADLAAGACAAEAATSRKQRARVSQSQNCFFTRPRFASTGPLASRMSALGRVAQRMSTSAICTALSAAPLRSWSPQTQKQSPLSKAQSFRRRPTSQWYFSAVKSGIG